ncbi:PREDICTED: RBPJ-interacting and tubulin-associated protein 1 [Nipponia nippon]|uniref:RBPJ-interacting and tubulin-associated protein 1 n=1 Tax=Nipponia nippon TaxID=128390 RepID=UPI0005115A54|nr:PREDICTED: RBPJ-interacting and tubulin-associated protein 1 [Nipponia nippon]
MGTGDTGTENASTGHRGHRHTGTRDTGTRHRGHRYRAQGTPAHGNQGYRYRAQGTPAHGNQGHRHRAQRGPWHVGTGHRGHRLRNRAPSFCDESLFGSKPEGPAWAAPRMRNEEVAKLHPLLWSPPPAPRSPPGLSPRARQAPLRAVHPPAPASPSAPGSAVGGEGESCVWKRPLSSESQGAPGRGRSQSLSRLNASSDGQRLASDSAKTDRRKNQSPLTAPATRRGSLLRGQSKSVSGPSVAISSKAVGGCKPRPPWK